MSYKVLKNFYAGDQLHSIGEDFQSDNAEQVQELLADGNIGDASSVEPSTEAPATDAPLVEEPVASGSVEPQAPVEPPKPVETPQEPVAPAPQPTPEQIQNDLSIA